MVEVVRQVQIARWLTGADVPTVRGLDVSRGGRASGDVLGVGERRRGHLTQHRTTAELGKVLRQLHALLPHMESSCRLSKPGRLGGRDLVPGRSKRSNHSTVAALEPAGHDVCFENDSRRSVVTMPQPGGVHPSRGTGHDGQTDDAGFVCFAARFLTRRPIAHQCQRCRGERHQPELEPFVERSWRRRSRVG